MVIMATVQKHSAMSSYPNRRSKFKIFETNQKQIRSRGRVKRIIIEKFQNEFNRKIEKNINEKKKEENK